MDDDLLVELVSRIPVFETLRGAAISRRELEHELDTSQTTVHRILTSLKRENLIRETDDGIVLTSLGRTVADEIDRFGRTVRTAIEIEPILTALNSMDSTLDVDALVGATVTRSEPENPYRPVERLLELLENTTTLRGMYRIVPNPIFSDRLYELLTDCEDVEVIYHRSALAEMTSRQPDRREDFATLENARILASDEVPVGLTITDEQIAIAGYDSESGILQLLVDTDHPEATRWAESVYAARRETAEPFVPDGA